LQGGGTKDGWRRLRHWKGKNLKDKELRNNGTLEGWNNVKNTKIFIITQVFQYFIIPSFQFSLFD
jgi:hypothetical protein